MYNNCFLYFHTREQEAIKDLLALTKDTRIGAPAEGAHLHIVHLSDASSSLDLIKVETFISISHIQMVITSSFSSQSIKITN